MSDKNPESEWTSEPPSEAHPQTAQGEAFDLPEEPLLEESEDVVVELAPEEAPTNQVIEGTAQPAAGTAADAPALPGKSETLSVSEERTWAMIAHLSVLLNLITGFLGPFVALIIYLVYKDRSRYVAYQAMQAFLFQLIWWGGAGLLAGLMGFITFLLVITVVGICLTPITGLLAIIFGLMPIASLIYGVIAAAETNQGRDFRYWLIGDWVRKTYTG